MKDIETYEGKIATLSKNDYIAIVVAKFNRSITDGLLKGALEQLKRNRIEPSAIKVLWVPGAFELPTAAAWLAGEYNCAAVICLGAVIKGDTSHDHYINQAISTEICRIGSQTGVPTIFGVLTCDTVEQALARSGIQKQSKDKTVSPLAGNKGAEAVDAALEMISLKQQIVGKLIDVCPY